MSLTNVLYSAWTAVPILLLCLSIYLSSLAFYRLFLSPISKFPGPVLAALTSKYEAYYDIVKGGQYTFKIQELHKRYGPIIRISPWELHVDDPEYFEKLYTREGRWDKYAYFCNQFGNVKTEFVTAPHDLHRVRRASVSPYFSRQKTFSLEPMIQATIEKLCNRIQELKGTGKPLPIRLAYECLGTDIITAYIMGKSYDTLDMPDWNISYHVMITKLAKVVYLSKQVTFLQPLIQSLPSWLVVKINPGMGAWIKYQEDSEKEVRKIKQNMAKGDGSDMEKSYPTVFHEIMYASNLPQSEKSISRMRFEAVQFVSAGTDTIANTLHMITFHVLDNPAILKRLREDILTVQPDPLRPAKLTQLENLTYLKSVILEGLRLGYGASGRLARIAPDRVIMYKDWEIPPGTPVGMTSVLQHHHEDIFPESATFNPDRWTDPKERQRLERYLASFGGGTRICVGLNLAWAELYMITAAVFSRFDLELYETTYEEHVKIAADMLFPQPKGDSGDMKVLVK